VGVLRSSVLSRSWSAEHHTSSKDGADSTLVKVFRDIFLVIVDENASWAWNKSGCVLRFGGT